MFPWVVIVLMYYLQCCRELKKLRKEIKKGMQNEVCAFMGLISGLGRLFSGLLTRIFRELPRQMTENG